MAIIGQNMPIIKQGSTDPSVLVLQEYLKLAGLFPGTITGSFGENTTNAVKRFQRENKLDPDGIVDEKTWSVLQLLVDASGGFPPAPNSRIKPVLKVGDQGPYVAELQRQLQNLGYYSGQINSNFDSNLSKAVKSFQSINKLSPDGVVGNDTWGALYYLYSPLTVCTGPEEGEGGGENDHLVYTVKAGDSLWSIAQQFGTTVDVIKELNGLENNNLTIGQQLKIPGTNDGGTTPDYIIHVVRSGDTLWNLAQRYGTTVDAIRALNNLTSDALSLGQELKIPNASSGGGGGTTPTPTPDYTIYVVKSGDTLWNLAQRYGTTVDAIRALNNLTSDALSLGQELKIPNSPTSNESRIIENERPKEKNNQQYVVKNGDTLWKLAQKYGTTVSDIKSASRISSDNLSIGQRLTIPNSSSGVIREASSDHQISYTVKSGDSLWMISKRYNTTVDKIIKANNLTSSLLSIGQILVIPS
ncbi:MAG: LysM peptidoglycan-binding domain-containing protein [Oscillospiraceae bacterium]|jgi:LysM repeat protein|nr:LysM peptidoglycan-binding domain-containing protein [Oscillospiraceae bacterium]